MVIETLQRVEIRETSLEELGQMMGIPIKLLPWWGSRRQSGRSGVERQRMWLCPADPILPKKSPEVRDGFIILWAGECHFRGRWHREQHNHRQTIEIKDAKDQAILVEIRAYTSVRSRYLLGMDGTAPFIVQVVRRVESVEEAFQWLMPNRVKEAIIQGLDVKCQGDWFFIPYNREPNLHQWDDTLIYRLYKRNHLYRNFQLCYSGAPTRHRASLVVYNSVFLLPCEVPIVKGKVQAPDHEVLNLKDWHLAIRNRSHPWRNTRRDNRRDD